MPDAFGRVFDDRDHAVDAGFKPAEQIAEIGFDGVREPGGDERIGRGASGAPRRSAQQQRPIREAVVGLAKVLIGQRDLFQIVS
jgi:hypothetical protein